MNEIAGALICTTGGLAGAMFALPFRGVKNWRYESYWFVYALVGLIVCPVALAGFVCPNLWTVLRSASGATLLRCFGFGILWGFGGLTWGLMIRYLGIGLGLAIGCGLCSATGTLIPPLVTGHAGDLVRDMSAVLTLVGVVVSLVGIVFVGWAGKLKEGELPTEEKMKAVAEFDFKKGIVVALFSGIASAGMNFGLQGGTELEIAARQSGADINWAGLPVLVVVLSGGFVVNAVWCLWQNARNGSFGDYRRGAMSWLFAGLAGAIWVMQFVCQKIGEPRLGDIRYISFALVMGSCVLFSSVLGIVLGEWRGTGCRTKLALTGGLVLLALSIVLVTVAKGL